MNHICCPNCENTMTAGGPCPECDHDDGDTNCDCAFYKADERDAAEALQDDDFDRGNE